MGEIIKKNSIALVVLCAFVVVGLSFGKLVTQPWYSLVELGGDGMKNMYNYLYESQFGNGIWYFGMNYPYGEHMVYTDGLPLISVFLASIGHVSPETAMTILWWSVACSWVAAIVFVYRILVHFSVSPVLSFLFSSLIVMMSPQVIRLDAHYSLSFVCVIPMLFYWSIRYHEGQQIKYAILISLLGILACLMHPYFSAMILIWVVTYTAGYFITKRGSFREKTAQTLPLVVGGIAVIAFFKAFLFFTDRCTDRAIQPFGFLEYRTRIKELITSEYSWIWHFLVKNHFVKITTPYGEGTAYLGLSVVLVLAVSFGCFVRSIVLKKIKFRDTFPTGFDPVWTFIAGAILLFSMGIPFVFHMLWLTDYLTIFRQFRSLGRFDWIFYFIATIFAALMVNKWVVALTGRSRPITAKVLLFAVLTVWTSETYSFIRLIHETGNKGQKNYEYTFSTKGTNWAIWLKTQHFNPSDFQAILGWGIVNIGTEKYWVGDHGLWGLTMCEVAALQLHLPVMDANLSRTSWSVSRKQTKLAAGPYADKQVLDDLKSSKPILLIQFEQESLQPEETYLLNAAHHIGDFEYCHVYALYPDQVRKNDRVMKDSVMHVVAQMKRTDTVIGDTANIYLDHFEKNKNNAGLFGQSAMAKTADSVLADIPIRDASPQTYEFSAWFLVDATNWASPTILTYYLDGAGKRLRTDEILTNTCTDHEGLWSRANAYLKPPPGTVRIVFCIRPQPVTDYILKDEVQLRPLKSLIISKLPDGKIMANNHWLK